MAEKRQIMAITHSGTLDRLFDKAAMKCVKCSAAMGACDCWTKCPCGWSFEKGTKCRNPTHSHG